MSSNIRQVVEVTGLSDENAATLLECFPSVQDAIASFFDNPTLFGDLDAPVLPSLARSQSTLPPVPELVPLDGPIRCGFGEPVVLECFLAWQSEDSPGGHDEPFVIKDVLDLDTVRTLKRFIASSFKIPVCSQRIVFAGASLADADATLRSCGLSGVVKVKSSPPPLFRIAVLYSQRDED